MFFRLRKSSLARMRRMMKHPRCFDCDVKRIAKGGIEAAEDCDYRNREERDGRPVEACRVRSESSTLSKGSVHQRRTEGSEKDGLGSPWS